MAEGEPKRRGRPRKNPEQAPTQPAQTGVPAQPEAAAQAAQPTTPEVPQENPVEQITHRFMRTVYKEGSDVMQALSSAQDELFTRAGVVESFQALHSMSSLGLEEAQERKDQGLIDSLTNRQRAFSSALRRLSPLGQTGGGAASGPTNPSNLPPMTGAKG